MSSLFQWLKVAVTFVRTNERRRRRRFTKRENEEGKIRHLRGDRQNGRVIGLQKMTKTINRAPVISDQEETKRKWALKMKFTLIYLSKRFLMLTQCLKISEKVSFNIASEASYVYIFSGQKFIKNAKNGQLKSETCCETVLPDRSILIGPKIGEKCQN